MTRIVKVVATAIVAAAIGCGEGAQSAPVCAPSTCEELGATCGPVADGCGGTLECGGCPEGDTCGGGGVANACGRQACVPGTCASLGKSCGDLGDGCGGTLRCGACSGADVCGGGGAPNVCGPARCAATTCAAQRKDCGKISDGCGGQLDCGACAGGETCGGGGTANVCGRPACTPTTCAAQKKACGAIADGCGGTLQCGACPGGQECNAANVCAAPPREREVRWSFQVSTPGNEQPVGAGVDGAGNRFLLSFTPAEPGTIHTLRLEKRAKDGKRVWERTWEVEKTFTNFPAGALAVTPAGNVFVLVRGECLGASCPDLRADLGGGVFRHSAVVKLAPDGRFLWQRVLTNENAFALATNEQGRVAVLVQRRDANLLRLETFGFDGAPRYAVDLVPGENSGAVALAPDGDALVVVAEGGGIALARLGSDGVERWRTPLPGAAGVTSLGVTARGTAVVLAIRVGDVVFGPSTVRTGASVIFAVEADGRPRWAQALEFIAWSSLAVDPTGRVAVVGQGGPCGEQIVQALQLDGTPLWRRRLPTKQAACWSTSLPVMAYGADHELFLGGGFFGPITLGTTEYDTVGQDVFAVELAP